MNTDIQTISFDYYNNQGRFAVHYRCDGSITIQTYCRLGSAPVDAPNTDDNVWRAGG